MTTIRLGRKEDYTDVSFPRDQLLEKHFTIVGATGQRKTLFLLSVLRQFLATRSALVVIDLGGDAPAYWILSAACRTLGKRLQLFSLNPMHRSYYFDPLVTGTGFTDVLIASNAVASGLNLVYSEGYGRSFWGRFNVSDINEAFDRLAASGIARPAFRDLVTRLKQIARERRRRGEVSEAILAADQLARVHHFGVAPTPTDQLDIAQVIENGDVAYFWLPSGLYGAAARAIATLASWCTMVEMAQRGERQLSQNNTHLAIDEYAQIAAGKNSLESQLVLSRKWGLQMWLVFQSREQMRTSDGDLWPVLRDNTQRFLFTVEGEEQQRELMNCSEDEPFEVRSSSQASFGRGSIQIREELRPKLQRNKILEISGTAMKLFGVFNLGDRHRDPIAFEIVPPTQSPQDHAELKARPLPTRDAPVTPHCPQAMMPPRRVARHAALKALYDAIAKERCVFGNDTAEASPQ